MKRFLNLDAGDLQASRRFLASFIVVVFLITLTVRFAGWYYWRNEAIKVQSTVSENYKKLARLFLEEGAVAFYQRHSAMSDVDLLGHPPGYSLFLAIVFRLSGESNTAIQLLQITADAIAAVILFLIATTLLGSRVGLIAGLLAALSPQFTWNAILILPDSLSVLPLLLAIYLIVLAGHRGGLLLPLLAGVLVGASCLLRPNNLLLAPVLGLLFALGVIPFHDTKGNLKQRLGPAAALILGTMLLIAPITIRNAVVFGHFIPISLGAGQTLLEGIADYDPERRFGIPETDVEIAEMEAREQQRPDYATTLFGADGIQRERSRLKRALSVIMSNPVWFVGVMVQRAGSMLRLERVPIISSERSGETGYPTPLRFIQKLYLTALILPLTLLGVVSLVRQQRWSTLAILATIPTYYFLFQSALHTEYRYIIALHYHMLVFAAVAIYLLREAMMRRGTG